MKKFTFFALAAALFCAGCEKPETAVPVETVTINHTELTVAIGETAQLAAAVTPVEADAVIEWSSDNEAVATVDESGLVTAVAVGTAKIKAAAGEKFAECAVTVYDPAKVVYGGVTYNLVTLADGNTWMAENLRYVPEGKTPSGDYTADAGIWVPAGADKVADPSLVETKGYLYDFATAFGVDALTEENAFSFEGKQGICPDGWHIPTNAELTGLVGQNANGALTDTNAPYYDADAKGALIDALNEAGFNWTFVGARNKTNLTAAASYLCTVYEDAVGALSYVLGSTCYQVQKKDGNVTNYQYYSLMSTYNASNKKVSVAYGNGLSGYSVRCVKNK